VNPFRTGTSLAASAFLALTFAAQAIAQPQNPKQPGSPQFRSNLLEVHVLGTWVLDVEATADILARGQFGTRQEITVKSGATVPETNLITKPFDPKEYEETRNFWATNLGKIKYQLIFNPGGTGEGSSYDADAKKRVTSTLKWTLHGSDLRLEYTNVRMPLTEMARVVSTNELHQPMEMLGGWFVLRPEKQARSRP
jgi:hypothetical protein